MYFSAIGRPPDLLEEVTLSDELAGFADDRFETLLFGAGEIAAPTRSQGTPVAGRGIEEDQARSRLFSEDSRHRSTSPRPMDSVTNLLRFLVVGGARSIPSDVLGDVELDRNADPVCTSADLRLCPTLGHHPK